MTVTTLTKSILAAALVAGTATAATAGAANAIFPGAAQSIDTNIELDLVTASANGTVDVYNYHGGERGQLLGSTDVTAGANNDVKIRLAPTASEDVLAVLTVNGQEVILEEVAE